MNPCVELRRNGDSSDSGRVSGFSSLLVCQEFVSQLNPIIHPVLHKLGNIYIQYINYNHEQETQEFILKYKKCRLVSVFGRAVVCVCGVRGEK